MKTLLKNLATSGTQIVRLITRQSEELEGTLNLYQEESNPSMDTVRLNKAGDAEPDRFQLVAEISTVYIKAVA